MYFAVVLGQAKLIEFGLTLFWVLEVLVFISLSQINFLPDLMHLCLNPDGSTAVSPSFLQPPPTCSSAFAVGPRKESVKEASTMKVR